MLFRQQAFVVIIIGLALNLSACGCKDEKTENGDEKKQNDLKENAGKLARKLVGKWRIDIVRAIEKAKPRLDELPEEERAAIEKELDSFRSSKNVVMEYTGDGEFIVSRSGNPETDKTARGTYKIKSAEGNSLVVIVKLDSATEEETDTVTFINEDTIEFTPLGPPPPGMELMTATRVK